MFGGAAPVLPSVPRKWVDTVVASLGVARPGLPIMVPVTEFRDIVGTRQARSRSPGFFGDLEWKPEPELRFFLAP